MAQQAAAESEMTKPVFTKVEKLLPGTSGHTLTVKVVSSKMVSLHNGRAASQHMRRTCISECIVGDEIGTIIFTARNEQVDLLKPDITVILHNAKINLFKGSMRLAVDKWNCVEITEPAKFEVKVDNNFSLIEFELVNFMEQ